MRYYSTCRLCHKATYETPNEGMVKVGVRHWEHWSCGFARFGVDGFLDKLTDAQKAAVPFRFVAENERVRQYLERWRRG